MTEIVRRSGLDEVSH